jgi:hypothetical protein
MTQDETPRENIANALTMLEALRAPYATVVERNQAADAIAARLTRAMEQVSGRVPCRGHASPITCRGYVPQESQADGVR